MNRVRRRSPLRPVAPLVAAVVTLVLALAPLGLAAAQPAAADTTTFTVNPIQVTLNQLTPIAPQPGDTLVVGGTLHNTSDTQAVEDLHYALKLGTTPIFSRDTFDSFADNQDGDLGDLGAPASPVIAGTPSTLAPGASEPYEISIRVDNLGLGDLPQVRELGVSVTSGTTVVGHLRTFLPWSPRSSPSRGVPISLAWVWPLVDRPHGTTPTTWYDDELAPELGPNGRLGGLLTAGATAQAQHSVGKHPAQPVSAVPVTWAIDPMLINEVKQMTAPGGYQVKGPDGTKPGTGGAAAKAWLARLRSALVGPDASVLPLPYADPDIVAALRAGFATTIGLASAAGRSILQALGPINLLSTFAWPPGGYADNRTFNQLVAGGDQTLVLSNAALQPTVTQNATPTAHTALTTNGGTVDTLLTDATLTTAVDDGEDNPDGSRVSLQRFLAETLMIHLELPSVARDVVVAPNRRWEPSPAYAAALLADTGKVPWITPVSLAAVNATPPDTTVERAGLTYPSSARHNELSPSYLRRVGDLRSDIARFSGILPQGDPMVRGFTVAGWQALSSAWRQQHALANASLNSLTSQVKSQMMQVRITSHSGSFVTLTSHGGKVPITIANNLDTPVNVVLRLAANQRLTHNSQRAVALPAHQQTVVDMHADAKTSGVFQLKVQLLTPKGRTYGDPVRLYVRSTAYGTITLVITGAATAALLVAVAIRLVRRARTARRASAATTQ